MSTYYKTATLDDKRICYTDATEFLVQVGRHKGAYQTRYRIVGDLRQAEFYYCAINIGNGYKKRLFVPSFNKPTLARYIS